MRSRETFSLLQSAGEIRVALTNDGERIGELLNGRFPPPTDESGAPLFDHTKHMQHLLHDLDASELLMTAAEDEYLNQQVVISRLQDERNVVAASAYRKLVSVRQGLAGLHGEKADFEMTLATGRTPRSADQLLQQLAQSVQLLRAPAVEPRDIAVAGFAVDQESMANDLDAEAGGLREAVAQLKLAQKDGEVKLLAKRSAIAEFRRTILWAGRNAEGLFHRAGESELADRIRSSTRRPLRPSEEEAQNGSSSESSDAKESDTESSGARTASHEAVTEPLELTEPKPDEGPPFDQVSETVSHSVS